MILSAATSLHRWYLAQQPERRRILASLEAKVTIARNGHSIRGHYPMRTLRLIDSLKSANTANALYQWTVNSQTEADEEQIRELIAFGVPYYEQVGKRMLLFAINRTKISHPRFEYHDLSEMEDEYAAMFRKVLSTLINVYRQRRTSFWVTMEDTNWNQSLVPCWEEAKIAFPVASEALIDLVISHPDRQEDIVHCIISRSIEVSSTDVGGLANYLESDSRALAEGAL